MAWRSRLEFLKKGYQEAHVIQITMNMNYHLVRLYVVIPGLVSLMPAVLAWLFSFNPFSITDFLQAWLVFFVAINLLFIVTHAVAQRRGTQF